MLKKCITWQPRWLSRNYKTQFPCDACFPNSKLCFPQHNLATTVDKEKVLAAYTDVMSDQKADINWWDFYALKIFFDGTSIFKILFAGHFSTTQTAQLVLKQQGKSFQISRHTLLRMTGASATLRLRWIYHNLFHCWSHQDNQGFAYIIDLDQRCIAIHFPKHIKTSRGWADYGSYKSPPSINHHD